MFRRTTLAKVSAELRAAREELTATEAQLAFLADEAADLRTRAMVTESPVDRREAEQAERAADSTRRHRDRLAAQVARLTAQADDLLDTYAKDATPS